LRTAVGLKPRAKVQRQYTEEQILLDLYRTWRPHGTLPKYHQHRRNGGKICASTIQQWYGKWTGAIAAYNAYCRSIEGWYHILAGKYIPPWRPHPDGRVADPNRPYDRR
jgi:hypothetical protein